MGDDGFTDAVTAHQRRVFTLAAYMLGSPQEAEDVTQEVFLRFWRHRAAVPADAEKAWLLRVTRNACIDRIRARKSKAWVGSNSLEDEGAAAVAWTGPGPETRAVGGELRDRLARALARLPEPLRSVVILREVQGLSYREMADVLQQPEGSLRVALHRGRRRLREWLKEGLDGVAAA